ncbi:MAG: hypothetical protein ACOC0M_02715 [Halomonas sp.]
MTDTPSQLKRLADLDPAMTLLEVAETLAQHGIPKATSKVQNAEGATLAAIAFFHGDHAQEFLDALDLVEIEGGLPSMKDQRIRELEKDNADLRYEVACWRGR